MLLHGAKKLLLPLAIFSVFLVAVFYSESQWKSWLNVIEHLPYWLFAANALLAAQFNRSRLAFISLFLVLVYAFADQLIVINLRAWLPADSSLVNNPKTWIFTTGLLWLAISSFMKDRGILSIHGVFRLAMFAVCMLLGAGWIVAIKEWFLPSYASSMPELSRYILLELFASVVLFVILVRACYQFTLVNAAILVTAITGTVYLFNPNILPLSAVLTALALCFALSIFADSYFLAYRDELTGLPSRRALNQLALSLGRNYSVAMMDVDHFKKFNDTYGHDIGDQVLKMVANKLNGVTGGGKVFRYGGEEFTVVFPRKSVDQVKAHLEAVRETIANYKLVIREQERQTKKQRQNGKGGSKGKPTVSVTISMGVVSREQGESFEQALKRADQALYKAKGAGRNCVIAG